MYVSVWILLGWLFNIDDTVVVCTPEPDGVKLVILKFDDVLYVLANIIELITNRYWVAPVISDSAPDKLIVNNVPDTPQVFVNVVVP